jgi:NADH-quinone oxidoreductase subunit L
MLALGWGVAAYFYLHRPDLPEGLARQHDALYRFLLNKWYFDELYDVLFVRPAFAIGRFLWKRVDGGIIDGAIDGTANSVLWGTRRIVKLQTGYVYHYAFAMLIGVAALITYFMLAGGAQP